MNTITESLPRTATSRAASPTDTRTRAREAYRILQLGFVVAPIVAGLDKFFHVLTDWDKYLPEGVNGLLGGHGHEFMLVAGVIEIAAGVGVALRPRFFAYVVSAWLLAIVGSLLLVPGMLDIALRDFGLALGALALARLSAAQSPTATR